MYTKALVLLKLSVFKIYISQEPYDKVSCEALRAPMRLLCYEKYSSNKSKCTVLKRRAHTRITHYKNISMKTYCVKAVVDEMFEILAHADLPHQFVLVAVHACQLAHMGKDVLQTIRQLEKKQHNNYNSENTLIERQHF
jgi:hypothetical protein